MEIINYEAHAGFGVTFPAKTFLIQDSKSYFIISPCDLPKETIDLLLESNKVINFISPNNFHNLHIKKMKELFPNSKFYGPKRSAKQSGVELNNSKHLSSEDIEFIYLEGNNTLSETCFYHKPSKTLIITDLFFNMKHEMNISTKLAMLMAGTYKKLGTSRIIKLSIKDKKAFKDSLNYILSLPIEKVVPSHGDPIDKQEFKRLVSLF
jgi:hypothetical protein